MKQFLKKHLPRWALVSCSSILAYLRDFHLKSYSQEGEDMVLRKLFEQKSKGFYVDVGAHHPKRFSNTYFFYKKGWSGINIDATPGSMKPFRMCRPRDTCIEAAVSCKPGMLRFYMFDEPTLNTCDEELVESATKRGYALLNVETLPTRTLEDVLSEFLPAGQVIDFMTVDVEGADLDVLKSSNWELYRPRYLLVERLEFDLGQKENDALCQYLVRQGYGLYGKMVNTLIFSDRRGNFS
jgi:FkbM family methyltransferase